MGEYGRVGWEMWIRVRLCCAVSGRVVSVVSCRVVSCQVGRGVSCRVVSCRSCRVVSCRVVSWASQVSFTDDGMKYVVDERINE